MRTGRVTQTIWNRSVKKQIQKGNRNSTGKTAWEESSSELISDEKDFVWSSASVSGKAPAQVKYAVIKAAGDLAAKRVRPTAVSVQILFPESSDEQELKNIMRILTEICEETGLAITCVQAESAEYVLRTVIQITAVGVKENPKQQMKKWFPGTEIILCGYTGLEGTLRLVEEAEADLRDLMGIPSNYKVLFLQGGASLQFSMIPMNLMKNGVADYIVTGQWAKKAYAEAQKYGKANKIASSEDKTFSYIPDCSDLPISPDADYVYICENNTIYGTKYKKLPNTKGKTLVADVSSCFLSEPVNVSDYGIIYGGVQKNIGPAGMVISIVRDDLITDDVLPGTPTMMKFKTHADAGSLYNTPNCYCIYMCGKVFKWLKKMGGLEVMKQRNEEKAKLLYDFLDQSKLFKGTVVPEDRSLMNVPFITGNADLDAKFVKESKEAGLENLKGHRTVGGMRASIYNAMPKEGVETLVAFMKKFEEENL